MRTLVLDTETTGLVKPDLLPSHPAQPHLVQLAAILYEEDGVAVQSVDLIVRPEGYAIPDGAAAVHGITTERALAVGVPLVVAVAAFCNLRAVADEVAAHNLDFDERVMDAAIHRTQRRPAKGWPALRACTKELADPILALPPTAKMVAAGYGHKTKPPTLSECYRYFFREELVGAHGAAADARACARVLFAIRALREVVT